MDYYFLAHLDRTADYFLRNFIRLRLGDWNNVDIHCRNSEKRTLLHTILNRRNPRNVLKFEDSLHHIESLVALGANVNAKDCYQMTPLHIAVENNDTESIECLLKLGADINAQYQKGVTSLSEAIRLKNVEAVRVLAQLGLAQSVDGVGLTVMYQTVFSSQVSVRNICMLKYLVYKGANINATVDRVPILHAAVQSGNFEIIQILLDNVHVEAVNSTLFSNMSIVIESLGINITDPAWFTELKNIGADFNLPFTGSSAVYEAVTSGRLDTIELLFKYKADIRSIITTTSIELTLLLEQFGLLEHLIKCGADINARFESSCSPLFAACRNRNIDIVRALWKQQDVAHPDHSCKGFTILFFIITQAVSFTNSSQSRRLKMATAIKKLISLGANVNIRFEVYNVLHEAVVNGDVNMVEEMAKLGLNVDDYMTSDQTPLTCWLYRYDKVNSSTDSQIYKDVVRSLIEAGADLNERSDLKRLLYLAVEQSDIEMVKTLARLGANMDANTKTCVTPIHIALNQGDAVDILDLLIEHGADPNAEYCEGVTPLMAALESKNTEIVQCLLQFGASPIVGNGYSKVPAFSLALHGSKYDAMRFLAKRRCDVVSADILTGVIEPFDSEVADIIAHLNLKTAEIRSETILSRYIRGFGNQECIEILLSLKTNKPSRKNVLQTLTDLQTACTVGDLDIVRLMIINRSDVNELDVGGLPPLAYLPLAHFINYPALQETKTKNVIEKVGFEDFIPLCMTFKKIDLLVSEPGIGDVQNIVQLNVDIIHEDVEKAILSLVEKCQILPGSSPWIKPCGSAAEGTKVGIPDEMDFLAVGASIDQHNIQYSKYDYVHCTNLPNIQSEQFHRFFNNKMSLNLHRIKLPKHLSLLNFQEESIHIRKFSRRATTPLVLLWKKEQIYEDVLGCLSSKMALMPCHVSISVDVVPSIHVKNWPEGAIEKTWLLNLDELKSHGFYIVPKPPHGESALAGEFTNKELQDLWKISFPHLETYHMQRLDKRVKDVYLLAKCIRNPDVCRVMVTDNGSYPRSTEKYVTSYMLKMIFFKNVEYFLSSNLSLGEMVCQVYDELVESLTLGFIPLYFMPHVNAVAGHDVNVAKSARAAKILKTFVHACYSSDCQGATGESRDQNQSILKRFAHACCSSVCQGATTGDSAESRDQNQSKSVYQSIEIGQTDNTLS